MKMNFNFDEEVIIHYMMEEMKLRKGYIADYLTGHFDKNNDSNKELLLERAIILAQLPLITLIEVSCEKENTITLYPIVTKMEVSSELYHFLISK